MKILKEISNINKAAAEVGVSTEANKAIPTQQEILLNVAKYKKIFIALIEFGEIFTNDETDKTLDEIVTWLNSLPTE